ncbi:hypothetical protein D2E26_1097 [Bifidobacterium dolichotidis]|uniref:Uncharacterized protein n=1 Tax=Bifidobacterium dolichotidis TaxID=2306976 RepID=A0A430FQC1_9BIFI|nr:hypothetical protein D2E26_1097 [Bifidobacterium dolichotidis]
MKGLCFAILCDLLCNSVQSRRICGRKSREHSLCVQTDQIGGETAHEGSKILEIQALCAPLPDTWWVCT